MDIHIHVDMSALVDQLRDVTLTDQLRSVTESSHTIKARKKGETVPLDPRSRRIEAMAEAIRKNDEFLEMVEEAKRHASRSRIGNASGTDNIDEHIKDIAKNTEGY